MLKQSFSGRFVRLIKGEEKGSKLRLMQEINRKIATSLDLDQLLNFIVDSVHEVIPYDAAAIYLFDEETQNARHVVGRGYSESEQKDFPLKSLCGIVGWVIVSGESVVSPEVSSHHSYMNCREKTRSQLAVPIISEGKITGAFSLEIDRPDAFTAEDEQWLSVLATQTAISIGMAAPHEALVEKKRLDEQVRIARDVQLSLLPTAAPAIDGLDIAGINVPSQGIGGDYFDFLQVADGHFGVIVADVVGKGVPAALIMASFRAFLRSEIRNNYAIKTIFAKVNNLLKETLRDNQFVSAFYGVLDLKRHRLTYSNAGHPAPLLIRRNVRPKSLTSGGPVLGILEGVNYKEKFIDLLPGDLVLLYTDGLSEAQNDSGEMFGSERIEQILRDQGHLSAQALCGALYAEAASFSGAHLPEDDTTIVVIKVA
ncbi:MAG: GAF domain-containing SpoIIE family protein phosphatase [Pyrinomonadaceae bacterium]